MNCFEGARSASDAAVKVSLGGAEVARLDLSPGPDGILSLHITRADSGGPRKHSNVGCRLAVTG